MFQTPSALNILIQLIQTAWRKLFQQAWSSIFYSENESRRNQEIFNIFYTFTHHINWKHIFYCKHSTDHKIKQQTAGICIAKKKLRYIEWVFTMEIGIKIKAILHQKLCIFTLYIQHLKKYFIIYLRSTNFLICEITLWARSEHRI